MGIKTIKNKHRSDRCKKYASLFGSGSALRPTTDRRTVCVCHRSEQNPPGFIQTCGKAQNPAGFAPCQVAEPKTRRVSLHVKWQSPKPGGFRSMSSGRAQNPAGFASCRVARPKTRRVSLHVEWQSPKPGGFRFMSSGKAQNPAGFALHRSTEFKTYRGWRSTRATQRLSDLKKHSSALPL